MGMTSALFSIALIAISKFDFFSNIIAFTLPSWLYTNAELVPLLPALLIVGGFIIFTLSYVSWRKYKGEQEKDKKKKERDKLVD